MTQVLRHLSATGRERDPNLLVGAETCDDAGVYLIAPDLALVQTLDFFAPVVDDPFVFGQIAAANSLSDVYAMCGEPRTALNIVCFPDDRLPLEFLNRILEGGLERVTAANAVIAGGHTIRDAEVKYGLSVTGVVDPRRLTTNAAARPGDVLFLTKPLGTGFVATAHKAEKCDAETLDAACRSMIELNAEAAKAMRELEIRCATDVTGFGLAGHALEMAEASDVSVILGLEALPILPGAARLYRSGYVTRASKSNAQSVAGVLKEDVGLDPTRRAFLFDPQTSGGLLIATPPDRAERLAAALPKAVRIGAIVESEPGVRLRIRMAP